MRLNSDPRPDMRASAAEDEIFAPFAADSARSFVVAQLGQSLDGRIATISGDSKYINGGPALDHLHRLRARVDAVIVGASTVAADDPQLTVRRVEGRNPARVVIDPKGRLTPPARWLERDGSSCFIVSTVNATSDGHCQHIRLPVADGGAIDPRAIVAALHARGMRRLLIEGGAKTISAFIDAGCVDRLHLLFAPIILGSGKNGLELAPIATLEGALRPATRMFALGGGEFLIDCDLRRQAET